MLMYIFIQRKQYLKGIQSNSVVILEDESKSAQKPELDVLDCVLV